MSLMKNLGDNRCLIIADGFYEWQHTEKEKRQYIISLPDEELFAFAGIYDEWFDKKNAETFTTYTIITTIANEFMSKIHNSKKRMPVILTRDNEKAWLNGSDIEEFKQVYIQLKATPV